MTTLYPKDFIPFNISTSSDEIEIQLGTSDPEVLLDYKQSVKPDIVVLFNSKPYQLHVLVMEQHSDIFWKGLVKKDGDMSYFDTKQTGNQLLFQKIISSIYGNKITIRRYDVQQFYRLSKIMHLTELQDILQRDMLDNFEDYDIFPLLKFATEQKILNVMAFCYETLELEHFQPIRYNKSGLFLCQPQLFRTIIKRHNYMKQQYSGVKFGLSSFQIQKLIEEYCYVNGIKGRRKQKFMADVENKQNCNYFFISKPNIDIFTTQRKINTCINLPQLTSLADIRQPQEEQQNSPRLTKSKNNKIMKMVSFANDSCSLGDSNKQSDQLSPLSPTKVKKQRSTDEISLMSFSPTYRKKKSHSPLKKLNRQFSQISDAQTMIVITNLSQSLKDSLKSSTQIEKKAEQMMASLKLSVKRSKDRTSKIQKMQGQLDEIYAQILSSQTRLEEVQKTVTFIQERTKSCKKEKEKKHKKFFQTSIALDLSISKEFGKNTLKSPELSRR